MKRVYVVLVSMIILSNGISSCTKEAVVPAYARDKPHAKMLRAPVAMDTILVSPGN